MNWYEKWYQRDVRLWSMDRKPTATERLVGIVSSSLLCAFSGTALWFLLKVRFVAWAAVMAAGFTVFSLSMLYRFSFTKGQSLSRRGQWVMACFFTFVGVGMLLLSFTLQDAATSLNFGSMGYFGIFGGIVNFTHLRRRIR